MTHPFESIVQKRELLVSPHDGGGHRILRKTAFRFAVPKHELSGPIFVRHATCRVVIFIVVIIIIICVLPFIIVIITGIKNKLYFMLRF